MASSSTTAPSRSLLFASYALLALAAFVPSVRKRIAIPTPERRFSPPQAQRALLPADDQGASTSKAKAIERGLWPLFRTAVTQWIAHKDARLGAALAYYSIFSLGPLIIIAIAIAGFFFGQELVRGEVLNNLKGMLGDTGVQAVEGMLGADKAKDGIVATIIGIATLIFAAVGVVVQLKDALNTVWEVKTPPGKGIWGFARTYVLSFAGVLSLGFLLLISMLVTTALAAGSKYLAPFLPEVALQAVSFAVSFAVITLLFAMMFKWLPDADVSWRDVWLGAAVTAFLFELGKFLIGLYIGKQGLESTYGAAASIVVVLIWVYYSAQIVLFGAEFTNVHAKQYGRAPAPPVDRAT